MGSRQSFATPHSRVPSAMIGQYTLKPDTRSNRDTGNIGLGNIGTGEHRFGEHRYRGTSVPGNIGTGEHRYRGTSVPGNIGLGNIGTGEHRYAPVISGATKSTLPYIDSTCFSLPVGSVSIRMRALYWNGQLVWTPAL